MWITGFVVDQRGWVLPGVTIEVSEGAHARKPRAAITNSRGEYAITDLRPGMYELRFSRPGYRTISEKAVALSSGLVAIVDAQLVIDSDPPPLRRQ